LARYISKAGGRAWLEPRFQIRAEDNQHTDVKFVFGPIMGYIDVYVVHPTAASYLRRGTAPLRIAAEVEAMKNAKYGTQRELLPTTLSFFHLWLRRSEGLGIARASLSDC
jgi:hypothetical protein